MQNSDIEGGANPPESSPTEQPIAPSLETPAEQPSIETAPPAPVTPSVPAKPKRDWMGSILAVAALLCILWAAVAAYGAGWSMWPRGAAIGQLYMAFIAGLVIALIALILMIGARKRGWYQSYVKRGLAIILGLGLSGYLASWWLPSATTPALHDISTSLADPPVFRTILLRDDNWDSIPEADNADYAGLSPRQRWQQLHEEAYSDVRTVGVETSMPLLMEKAERLAQDRGWDIVDIDAADGRLEARTTSSPMAYPHDVAVRIRPAEGGNGAIVDMRSVSAEGNHDLGANAEIIRSYLADLSGTTSGVR